MGELKTTTDIETDSTFVYEYRPEYKDYKPHWFCSVDTIKLGTLITSWLSEDSKISLAHKEQALYSLLKKLNAATP